MGQRIAHGFELCQLVLDLFQVILRHAFHIGAGAGFVLVERQKGAAILDGKAKRAGAAQKGQLVRVGFLKPAVSVGIACGPDQADILVIADGLGGQAGAFGDVRDIHAAALSIAGLTRRRRRALDSTNTELSAIAPAASIGESIVPVSG